MMEQVHNREAVFFDFDGVILDSCHVKTRAFAALYAQDHPDIVDAVIEYHNANGGVSRHKKFEHYERVLLRREPSSERLLDLADRFAKAVVDEVLACAEIPGARDLLRFLSETGTPCYVVSGTPEDELQMIVRKRSLARYFREVRGAPAEKHDLLGELTVRYRHDTARCLMIGDATTDFRAAAAVGMPFLGVAADAAASPFPPEVMTVSCFQGQAMA
jgi:phosphoglycolate phosphatase-like HAD superfamily hydrolase